jgi:hypothetical protein
MKKPLVFLALSLAANAALVVTYFVRPGHPDSATNLPPGGSTAAGFHDSSGTGLSAADASALKRSGELITGGDLHILVARLRAAGFPGSVIRGIITAEVADLYGARRKAAVAHQQEIPFWRASQGSFPYDPKAGGEIARLGREQTAYLRELLGPDAAASDDWSRLIQQRKYGTLSQDKIDKLQDILADYNDLRAQFSAEMRGVFLPEDRAKFQLLQKEQRADLVNLFTPEELEEYDMRTSSTAGRLRSQLESFQPSEDEFRTIFRLTQAFEIQNGNPEFGPVGDVTRDRAAAMQQLQADVAAALGPDRAAAYQQAMNPAYQQVNRLLTRFDLPATLAPQVVSVQQDIEQRANAVRQDKTLSPDDRTSQLAGLAQEAQTRLTTTLGVQAYEAYKFSNGGWINNLAPPALRLPVKR